MEPTGTNNKGASVAIGMAHNGQLKGREGGPAARDLPISAISRTNPPCMADLIRQRQNIPTARFTGSPAR